MIETRSLSGAPLAWACVKALGGDADGWPDVARKVHWFNRSWALGGSVIESYRISALPIAPSKLWASNGAWEASLQESGIWLRGATPLEAAMRALVRAKLGESVEVPEAVCALKP